MSKKLVFFFIILGLISNFSYSQLYAQGFICRAWSKSDSEDFVGNSFTLEIVDSSLVLRGAQPPLQFASLVYSHPLYDVFIAPSGVLLTAGRKHNVIDVRVFFPNNPSSYFLFTTCSEV